MTQKSDSILIAGAGIGGLVAGLALARGGASVDVFETADQLLEAGAGLQLSANAMHVLAALGLEQDLQRIGFEPEHALMRDYKTGRPLLRVPLKGAHHARYGQSYYHVHRADLHSVILRAAEQAGVRFHLGETANSYAQDERVITLQTDRRSISGKALIAADGIKSNLRKTILGEGQANRSPEFTGQTAWRGLICADLLPAGLISHDANVWLGPEQHFVTYALRGAKLINFVAVKEKQNWADEDWSRQGDVAELCAAFSGWDSAVTQLLAACESCHLWGLFDHKPLRKWTDGRAALLGDAAHAMLPFMAQGAAMAIEDGYVLARQILSKGQTLQDALTRYEALRLPRTAKLQAISRANAKLYHVDGAVQKSIRAAKFKLGQNIPALTHAKLDPIYGYDATKT